MNYPYKESYCHSLFQLTNAILSFAHYSRLVLEQISKLEDDRKCWRLINGILFEKTKAEVVPELTAMVQNLG